MKKITLKNIAFLLIFVAASQMHAQFNGAGSYLLKAFNADVYITTNNIPTTVIPPETNAQSLTLSPLITPNTDNTQVFEFVPTGDMADVDGNGDKVVYNVLSRATNGSVIELRNLVSGTRMGLRGNSAPTTNELATFVVFPSITVDGVQVFRIRSTTSTFQFLQTNADDALNYGSASSTNREKWFFEAASPVLSTNDIDTSSVFVSNPVKNALLINGLTSNVKDVSVYSLLGNLVLQSSVNGESSLTLNTSSISSGMYIVKLSGENVSFSKKIIKN